MAWISPVSRATGYLVTAARWNQDVVDNGKDLHERLTSLAADGAITTAKLADNAVTADKLAHNINATGIGLNADAVDGFSLRKLTKAQYDALVTKDANTLYLVVG